MKLLVKTLTGGKFDIQVEESNTVAEVKAVIVSPLARPLAPVAEQRVEINHSWITHTLDADLIPCF